MDKHAELEAFVAVVQEGGFSAAARKLGLTPSALSKQVSRLEERLGVSLLHRNTRGVSPTDVGRSYYEGGEAIVQRLAALEDLVTQHGRSPQGVVRVSVSHGLARLELVSMLRTFIVQYPDIRVVLELNDSFVDLVAQGIDLAIRAGELSDSTLIARRVAAFERMIVASPAYLEAHGVPARPQDLLEHNCLRRSGSQPAVNRWPFVGADGPLSVDVTGMFEASTVEV
ncbi:MAG: LysR family transcriptional regulator, partial [Deltaproteobacteria bacterium]|nr:LysR family transcriptional regulator [Deltaproteobacteria bacterium]